VTRRFAPFPPVPGILAAAPNCASADLAMERRIRCAGSPWSRVRLAAAVLACAYGIATAVPAGSAQIFEKVGTFGPSGWDPSARSQAMGGASGAVFWGADPNHWANPALLGLAQGIRYEDADESLLFDTHVIARREVLGYGGLGAALEGRPFPGLGGLEVKLPLLEQLLPGSYDRIRSWGIGASLSRLAGATAALRHREAPAFTRYADLAFGYNHKSREFGIAEFPSQAVAVDWGLLVRAGAPLALHAGGGLKARVDAAYSYSVQNSNDASASGSLGPVWRPHRHGLAARAGLAMPARWRSRLPVRLAPGFEPLLSIGGAWDREFITVGSGRAVGDRSHAGMELGLGNVVFVRFGHRGGTAYSSVRTSGYGLALPIGEIAGVRYDHATIAFPDFPGITTRSWMAWVNPVELVRALR